MHLKLTAFFICICLSFAFCHAQEEMSLDDVIHTARNQSVEALQAKQAFISTYWAYRSYKASRLPSVYMYGNIMNFDRSLTLLQNPENGTLNYRLLIENFGNVDADVGDNVALSDLFDPVLSGVAVSLDGTTWTEGTQYTYNETTGQFNTVAGQITVPAATYTQDIVTGIWSITPGTAILTVTGTI